MTSNASGDAPTQKNEEEQVFQTSNVLEEAYKSWVTMGDLRHKGLFCDVVLKTQDGRSYPAHRMVLCVCGDYFRSMFSGRWQTSDQREIIIPGVTGKIMEQILLFAYCLKVNFTSIQDTKDLLIVSNHLGVEGIVRRCISHLQEVLDCNNCIGIYDFARTYYCERLKTTALKFILKNIVDVSLSPTTDKSNFRKMSFEDVTFIFQHDELNVKEESITTWLLLRWVEYDLEKRLRHLPALLRCIRASNMSIDFVEKMLQKNQLVQLNHEAKELVGHFIKVIQMTSDVISRRRFPRTILLAVGGWCQNSPTDTNEIYEPRSRQWKVATQQFPGLLKFPRAYHAVLFMKGWVYIVGGLDGVVTINSCERYNLTDKKWENLCGMHSKRCYVGVASLDGFLYAVGGANGNPDEMRLKSAEKLDPDLNIWTQLPDMYEGRSDAGVTSSGKRIYVVGGFNGRKCLFSVEYFDVEFNQWSGISPMRVPRSGVSAVAYKGRIVVLGGYDGRVRLSTVEVYDPATNRWGVMPPMVTERSNFSSCVVEGKLLVMGGFDGSSTCPNVEYYDETNSNSSQSDSACTEFKNLVQRASLIDGKTKKYSCQYSSGMLSNIRCCLGSGSSNQFNTAYIPSHPNPQFDKWVRLPDMVVSRSALSCCVVTDLEPQFLDSVVNSPPL